MILLRIYKSLFTLILLCSILLQCAFASEDSDDNSILVLIGRSLADSETIDRVYGNDPGANNSKMSAIAQIEEFKSHGIDAEWIPVDQANTEFANDETLAGRID